MPATASVPKRRLSASGRVAVTMTALLAVAVAALCVLAYFITLRNLTIEIDRTLVREASAYTASVRSAPATEALATATRSYLEGRSGSQDGVTPILLLLLNNGRAISNSGLRLEHAANNQDLRAPLTSSRYSDVTLDGARYRVISVAVRGPDGTRLGVFQAAISTGPAHSVATDVAAALAAGGLAVLLMGALLSVSAARGALVPLTRMAADASMISLASPGKRIAYSGPADELGTLADALNAMLGRLERAYDDQRRFIADASHELRTPVAIVRGNVELLRGGRFSERDTAESLAMIENEAVRMTRLLDELLSLARLQGTEQVFQPLEARTMLDEAAARARALGNRDITVSGPADLWVDGSPDLLDQALLNVLRNALAHTGEGGHISLSCEADKTWVRLMVTDDGPGIPSADLARIFDRFYRAPGPRPSNSGGAGLGLAIAKRLIDLHNGTITAENVPGGGARFTVQLRRIAVPADLQRA